MAVIRHLEFVLCVRITHKGPLVVFIVVQNLVGIDAVVLIICMFFISHIWLENAYLRPKIGVFGGFDRLNEEHYQRDPKRHILGQKDVI